MYFINMTTATIILIAVLVGTVVLGAMTIFSVARDDRRRARLQRAAQARRLQEYSDSLPF